MNVIWLSMSDFAVELESRRKSELHQVSLTGQLRQMWHKIRTLRPTVLLTALLLVAHHPIYAADFFVDADGGDDENPGSIEYPWRTIAKVMKSAGSGDSVYFQRGDIWKETLSVPASNMIFDAYGNGAKPTIDGENSRLQAFYVLGKHDITIRNFNIINATGTGIQFNTLDENITYNLTVVNNDFTNMERNGVRTYVQSDVLLNGSLPYGITIQGNTFTDLGNFAIGLNVTDTAPNIISENIIIRAGNGNYQTNAIQLNAKGLIVEKNIILDTKGGPLGDGHAIILDWGVSEHPETASENIIVRYNYVSGANTDSQQSGIHIWYGKNNKIYGNISVNNSIGYKLSNSASTGNEFYNNVAYGNTISAATITNTAPVSIWKNNIFYGLNNDDAGMRCYGSAPVESNNIFYNFTTTFDVPGSCLASLHLSDKISDPLFRNPQNNDFSLQDGSPAINAGADLTTVFSGLVMPDSIPANNIAIVDHSTNSPTEIGAYAYRDTILGNKPPTLPILISTVNNESRLGSTVDFVWRESTDPDTDALTYRLTYCTDQSFSNCEPVNVSMSNKTFLYADSLGFLIIGTTFIGGLGRRKAFVPVYIVILIGCASLMSCEQIHEFGAGQITQTVTDLAPDTTYYWKVEADDSKGGVTQSVVWSFSTQ